MSSTQPQVSQEAMSQFAEVFEFLRGDREDVRKLALHGIAEQSKDNMSLWTYLSASPDGPRAIDDLLQYLHVGGINLLGDILSILINCAADGTCAEALVHRKVVRKTMRLLDGLERSSQPRPLVLGLEEMALMLLSNLTASHLTAVDDLLQKDDEDMRGFYLGKLQTLYVNLTAARDEHDRRDDHKDEGNSSGTATQPPADARDLPKWILQIVLNLTRADDGQEQFLEDEEWRVTLTKCLRVPRVTHRYLAVQCYRNCSTHATMHPLLLKSEAVVDAVAQLAVEPVPELQMCFAEFIANMLQSEEGMARLESVNAKKALQDAVQASQAAGTSEMAVLEEGGATVVPRAALTPETISFLEKHFFPYLDDIIDAYIAPGSDELD